MNESDIFINFVSTNHVPLDYRELKYLDDDVRNQYLDAISVELKNMIDHDVFEFVEIPKHVKLLNTRYVFTLKDGKPTARLVARGDRQEDNSFLDTFSPTLQIGILKFLIAFALNNGYTIYTSDFKRAYLNADLDFDIFIRIPEGFNQIADFDKDNFCIKLKKALYGLKQAGHLWFKEISQRLIDLGFVQFKRTSTLFINPETGLIVAIYVDDLLILVKRIVDLHDLYAKLSEFYELLEPNKLTRFLGVDFTFDSDYVLLDLSEMITNLCDKYQVQPDSRVRTPLIAGDVVGPALNSSLVNSQEYQSIIGCALYISRIARPDVLFPVIQLSQFQQSPKKLHLRKLMRILTYLSNTKDLKFKITRTDGNTLIAYSDASLGNNYDLKSFYGSAVFFENSLIGFTSKKSSLTMQSSNESEIYAANEAMRDLLFYRYTLCAIVHGDGQEIENCDLCLNDVPKLMIDNTGCIQFSKNGYGRKTRYLPIRLYALKELSDARLFEILHVRTKSNLADIFTKNLKFVDLEKFIDLLGLTY